ncbi:putative aminotransferase family protein [Colletotrichum phormii]|uniref:Aminotransferase family protein n=1 Tax=Colletotrichum phormii TaxID=359342 RepID=A0AAJ0EPA8_9PEZI|nr:putative aminotransferase family protein [Colletotrichum phormii]KAK1656283.1 putative aminotransferase family protein [Colletotrichum phormii]
MSSHNGSESPASAVAFGTEIRGQCFSFAEGYHPLNHGSFGAFPKELLRESKAALAPLLGAEPGEVVFVQNATTGVNTVLRNLNFKPGDTVLHFSTTYGSCLKTIQSLSEECSVSSHAIGITYPIDDDEILRRFRCAVEAVKCQRQTPKLAIFDTVLTFPGVMFPFERLVATCKELKILSLIDGAHGVGHIDLSHLGGVVKPDFFISNCYKWLMVPRGCAALYVPYRNQEKITSTERDNLKSGDYFSKLFDKISTTDNTPYYCIPVALGFRSRVCGGEAKIREYCEYIARLGGDRTAEILGTEVLGASSASFRSCCFVNVRLPLTLAELDADASAGRGVAKWMQELTPAEYETYIPIKFYAGSFWCRISGQVYLTLNDFEWAAQTLLDVCTRAKTGEWRWVSFARHFN